MASALEDAGHAPIGIIPPPAHPVLLVEDHPVNRQVAKQTLERLGCKVEIAVNGRDAVEKAGRCDYAAVLMDCRMPEMDGYRAAKAIRDLPGGRGRVPIIALTASAEESERRKCEKAGMDDFISKPIRRQELSEVIRRWTAPGPDGDCPESPAVSRSFLEGITETFGEPNPTFVAELIQLFIDACPETLGNLDATLGIGDGAGAARAAHTLQGAGAQMGAVRLAGICHRLEQAAASGRLESAREILPLVKEELARVERELRKLSTGIKSPETF